MEIAAGEFKARCLKLMGNVQKHHEDIIITKYGKPVAKFAPNNGKTPLPLFGFLKGTLTITGDIVLPLAENWHVDK